MDKKINILTEDQIKEIQAKHREDLKAKRDAIKSRKERAHRLIVRGAISEGAVTDAVMAKADEMTDQEFRYALYKLLGRRRADDVDSQPQASHGNAPRGSASPLS